jgi:hypothetical protein
MVNTIPVNLLQIMIKRVHEKYIMLASVIGLPAHFICSGLAILLFPPELTRGIPMYSAESIVLIEFGLSFLLLGSTVMGLKLEDEKKILPAAGFTMLAISIGVMMSSLFEITQDTNNQSFEKLYYITVSSNFLYFPAMILIAFYDGFKKWIRILGLISCVPLLIATILFLFHYRIYFVLETIMNCGYLLMGITQCLWAFSVYKNYRRKIHEKVDS